MSLKPRQGYRDRQECLPYEDHSRERTYLLPHAVLAGIWTPIQPMEMRLHGQLTKTVPQNRCFRLFFGLL